jgi:hypothetical protein
VWDFSPRSIVTSTPFLASSVIVDVTSVPVASAKTPRHQIVK